MPSSSEKPTIVFAPGAWHTPDCFDGVRAQLEAQGWPTEAVAYPSVGAEPATRGLDDDAAALRAALVSLVEDQGRAVVLVVHSYGGCVGANAVAGLGRRERAARGLPGGVALFVYLSAFVVPEGNSLFDMLGGQWLPWMNMSDTPRCTADTPEDIFYHDLTAGAREKALARLQHQSAAIFQGKTTHEPWHHMDCMYLFCDEDRAIPLPVQEMLAAGLGDKAITYHLRASHSPFLSVPEETVKGILYGIEQVEARA